MESVKISFGFDKRVIKPNVITTNVNEGKKKVEFIECLEGHSIKVKDTIEEVEQPLIIPLKDEHKNLLDKVRAAKKRDKQLGEEAEDNRPDSELTANELAARQLLREAKDQLVNSYSKNHSKISILHNSEAITSQEGKKEPTLEDYESVPISDYGLAMLRGMGWREGMAIGKNSSKFATVSVPELRPKGLGLGAEKIVKPEIPAKKALDLDGNELVLRKGCVAKVIGGPKKGNYCEVLGFDEEAGRVIVQVYPERELLNISESLVLPVTKEESLERLKGFGITNYGKYKTMSKEVDGCKIKKRLLDFKRDTRESKDNFLDLEDTSVRNSKKSPRNQNRNKLKAPSKNCLSESDYYEEKERSSKSDDRSRTYFSSKYNIKQNYKNLSPASSSSDDDRYLKRKIKRFHETVEPKNLSTDSYKKDEQYTSDKDYYEKSKRHSKSKNSDSSRSESREEHRKHMQDRDNMNCSEDEGDDKKEKRKKNKCKSRHRRSSSSSNKVI